MSGLGEQMETILKEAVEEYLGERDFKDEVEAAVENLDLSDQIKDGIRDEVDVDSEVEKAMNDFDFSDAIHDAVRDYDWWEEIKGGAEDSITQEVENRVDDVISDKLDEALADFVQTDLFKDAVRAALVKIGKDILAEVKVALAKRWARVKEWVTWPYRKLRG